jgi:hypothetical protein
VTLIVVKDGQKIGPFTVAQINAHLAGGSLEPTDLGWAEGFDTWYPLSQIQGLVMSGAQEPAPSAAEAAKVVADDSAPSIKPASEPAEISGRSRWVWAGAVALVIAGGLGAYQFALGKGDLSFLCSVLVEVFEPPKAGSAPVKVVPAYVRKYQNAAKGAESQKSSIDAVNEHLDLRGDFHSTRSVKGLSGETDVWLSQFAAENAGTPEAQGIVELAKGALLGGGINEVTAYGLSSATVKPNLFQHTAMLHHPTNSPGRLWKMLDNNGTGLVGLRLMPRDTVLAIHGRVQFDDLSKWVGEHNGSGRLKDSSLLKDAWVALKEQIPIEQLQQSWNGEVGLYLTLNPEKFRVNNVEKIELKSPGLMLVLGVKDDGLEKTLSKQLTKWQKPVRTMEIWKDPRSNKEMAQLWVHNKLQLPDELSQLELIPQFCQARKYLVLSISIQSEKVGPVASLRQHASTAQGTIAGTASWAALSGQVATSMKIPMANLALFVAPEIRDEWAKWQKLDFFEDIDPSFRNTLMTLVGSKQDGGMLAFLRVLPNGILFKGHVQGQDSRQSFQQVKQATRAFVAELTPQLAVLAHQQWSKLELPAKPEPKPAPQPETPENTGSNGN